MKLITFCKLFLQLILNCYYDFGNNNERNNTDTLQRNCDEYNYTINMIKHAERKLTHVSFPFSYTIINKQNKSNDIHTNNIGNNCMKAAINECNFKL